MKRGLNKENSLPDPEFGGESSESARAIHYVVQKDTLMTYVSARFAQADPGIVSGSTTERKKMSTKTSFKRIALVAVTALGAGVLSVAPASASTLATVTSVASATINVAVGATASSTFSGSAVSGDTGGLTVAVTTKPTGSTVTLTERGDGGGTDIFSATGAVTYASPAVNTGSGALTFTDPAATVTDKSFGTLSIVPDKPGVYVLTISGNATSKTITVNAGHFLDAAGTKNLVCTVGSSITSSCTGVQNGRVGVLVTNLAVSTVYYVTVTGGKIDSATEKSPGTNSSGEDLAVTNTNGVSLADGATITTDAAGTLAGDGVEILVSNTAAANATIKVETFDATTGIRTVVATGTLVYGSAAALDLASVKVYGTANGTSCSTSITADAVNYLAKAAASNAAAICIYTLNGNGTIKTGTAITVTGNGIGTVAGGAAVASETATANTDGISKFDVGGNGLSGTGIWTVSATDGVKTVTGTLSVKYYDSVASIAITQTKWGLKDGDANDNGTIATFSAKDKNNFPVAFGTAGSSDLVVDSDVASTQVIAVAGDNDSSATETLAASTVSALGVETAGTIAVNVSATFEKVTLKIHALTNTVASNTITYHATTDAFASLVVGAVNGAAGSAQDVTATGVAKITGKTGYIIADSATATFFATAGALSSTSAVNFKNGVATVSFATPLAGGSVQIKATPSETATVASAVKDITVAAAADMAAITTLINSLIAKINALNKLVIKIQKKVRA
jgi:trimeric autotransporter adhesin